MTILATMVGMVILTKLAVSFLKMEAKFRQVVRLTVRKEQGVNKYKPP